MSESLPNVELRRTNALLDTVDNLELVSWTAPNGCVFIDRPEVIREIVAEGTWR